MTPEKTPEGSRCSLNDLPKFSGWPARLLGVRPWQRSARTPEENFREYEGEKWGPLLRRVREAEGGVGLDEVDAWVFGSLSPVAVALGDELQVMPPLAAHRSYRELVALVLARYWPATALVELGCGYGAVVLDLARRPAFRGVDVIAGEYTASGVELTGLLARAQGTQVRVGTCDFLSPKVTELPIPEGSLVFTSYATHYAPVLPEGFVAALARRRPKAVVHFEPCHEHCDESSLLGLLRKRYVEVNDYNRNLVTLLRQQQAAGRVRIIEERPAVFGSNPLLPASVVAWEPRMPSY